MWEYRAAPLHVIDGDTIRVLADTGFSGRHEIDVRLLGVSAPELNQPGGEQARDFTRSWIYQFHAANPVVWPLLIRTSVTTTPEPTERRTFTRYVADVRDIEDGASLNSMLADYLAQHPEWGTGT